MLIVVVIKLVLFFLFVDDLFFYCFSIYDVTTIRYVTIIFIVLLGEIVMAL